MKRVRRIAAAALFVATWGTCSVAQAGHSSYDSALHSVSSKPQNGFLDFTLKRINPSDANYGQCLSEDRRMLLEETVTNTYFWSNVVALGVLSWLFLVVVYQHKVQTRREWTTAEIVAELEQSVARSRAQLADADKKNGELKDALAALKESASRSPSAPAESNERADSSAEKLRPMKAQSAPSQAARTDYAKPLNGGSARSATAKEPVGQMGLFTPDADFIMKLNSLEQQLAQSREDNKQLRRRMADVDRRRETEVDKNRQLKGA
jgi:septal ring factor EnvC (AmiA/AmiB activator)